VGVLYHIIGVGLDMTAAVSRLIRRQGLNHFHNLLSYVKYLSFLSFIVSSAFVFS
jgi:hypothetical protein